MPPQTGFYPTLGTTANPYVPENSTLNEVPNPKPEAPTRVSLALKQLFEMGFWNQKLNKELLEKNDFDVNDTIEELLSPSKRRDQTNVSNRAPEEPVVSHQPRNSNGFIDEFD